MHALISNSEGDKTYARLEKQIAWWAAERDAIAQQIKSLLEGAQFNGQAIDENQAQQLISAGQALLNRAGECAAEPEHCGSDE
jgi:hypothetical protein